MVGRILVLLSFVGLAEAAEWEQSLATVPSLRTGGASLVSSDAVEIESDRYALITYWESRSRNDVDFYRCVDIADSTFATVRQDCWKALRPTGRAPATVSGVTSSDDICGEPNRAVGAESIAFCNFSESLVLTTPFFEIALSPFEQGGLVAVREQGRHLIVVDESLPASVLLEVRAGNLADQSELTEATSAADIVRQPPDGFQCAVEDFAGREWAVCRPDSAAASIVQFLIDGDTLYQAGFDSDVSATDMTIVRATLLSFHPISGVP